jgi:cell wall-associated NlpC family hydrolase
MINTGKYIQIPFKSGGRDFNGCDCYGLVRLVLKEEFGKELPMLSNEYKNANVVIDTEKVVKKNLPLLIAKEKGTPDEGDVGVFSYRGHTSHVGVYVGRGKVLHILSTAKYPVCEKLNSPFLKGRLNGFYEV